MANFRKKTADISAAATRKSSNNRYTPKIYWNTKEGPDEKYIQFLHPLEGEAPTVLMHDFIKVGVRDNGSDQTESFVSPKDPGLNGADGYDPLWDQFGIEPKAKTVAFAIELEPETKQVQRNGRSVKTITGFHPVMRSYDDKDGTTHEVPTVGVIIESPFLFWPWFVDLEDEGTLVSEKVFKIKAEGKGTDKKYIPREVGEAIPLEDLNIPDEMMVNLDEYLENLGSEDRMHELIDPKIDVEGWVFSRYGQKKSPARKDAPAKAVNDTEDEAPVEATPAKLSGLRAKLKAKQEAEEEAAAV